MNNDGLMDVVSGGAEHNSSVSWWENLGQNNFEEHIIDENLGEVPRYVFSVDFDFDNDMDVFAAVLYSNDIIWYKNNGLQEFTPVAIDTNFIGAHTIDIKDLDSDGDLDVLCSGFDNVNHEGEIAWWENDNFYFYQTCDFIQVSAITFYLC